MEDNWKKSDTTIREAQVLAKLIKLKSPKLSNAILKENVREEAILGTKLDLLSQHQKKYQFDLTWKKQLLLKRQKELFTKSNSISSLRIPSSRCFTLPPIEPETATSKHSINLRTDSPTINGNALLVKNAESEAQGHQPTEIEKEGKRETSSTKRTVTIQEDEKVVNERSSYDKSNERALLRWKYAISKAKKQVRKPILLSPLISEKSKNFQCTRDPRFARLVEQLIPNIGRGGKQTEEEDDEEVSEVDDT